MVGAASPARPRGLGRLPCWRTVLWSTVPGARSGRPRPASPTRPGQPQPARPHQRKRGLVASPGAGLPDSVAVATAPGSQCGRLSCSSSADAPLMGRARHGHACAARQPTRSAAHSAMRQALGSPASPCKRGQRALKSARRTGCVIVIHPQPPPDVHKEGWVASPARRGSVQSLCGKLSCTSFAKLEARAAVRGGGWSLAQPDAASFQPRDGSVRHLIVFFPQAAWQSAVSVHHRSLGCRADHRPRSVATQSLQWRGEESIGGVYMNGRAADTAYAAPMRGEQH